MVNDFTPFLQIVHISDLHVVDPQSPHAAAVRRRIRGLRNVSAALANWIADGTAPHDPLAVPLFMEFLEEVIKDPEWKNAETWLVDTGDLTSLGDQASMDLGLRHLKEFVQVCPTLASTYGNHDAWPGEVPLLASASEITSQGQVLSNRNYSIGSPQFPLSTGIPNGNGRVMLYSMDSVIHDRWKNTFALGEVSDSQLNQLKTLVDQSFTKSRRDLRILAVHHPVHYPPPRPDATMVMRNDRDVAAVLDSMSPAGAYPLAHLVLSGHTHSLYPALGELPSQPDLCNHDYLGTQQCQLVVGSLMQLDRYNKRRRWPHQCQILRFHSSQSRPSVLSVQRLFAARQAGKDYQGTGIGPYKFVPYSSDGKQISEEITFIV